jgi:hypothetical protein
MSIRTIPASRVNPRIRKPLGAGSLQTYGTKRAARVLAKNVSKSDLKALKKSQKKAD